MKSHVLMLMLLASSLFVLNACYSDIEGCLDPVATNFNPDADDDCCCNYPQVDLSMIYLRDTFNFLFGDTMVHNVHDQFIVSDFKILMHEFGLDMSSGIQRVSDLETYYFKQGIDSIRMEYVDDFILMRNRFNYSIGTISEIGTISNVYFRAGLAEEAKTILPASLEEGSALKLLEMDGYWDQMEGYEVLILDVIYGTDLTTTKTITLSAEDFSMVGTVPINLEKPQSSNLTITLEFDIEKWLEDVNFELVDSELGEVLEEKLQEALKMH